MIGVIVLGLVAVVAVAHRHLQQQRERSFDNIGPPPPAPPNAVRRFTGGISIQSDGCAEHRYVGDAPFADPVVIIYPDCHGNTGKGESFTGSEMIATYGVNKTKGMIGYLAAARPQPLQVPIYVTPKEVNAVSTAWGGSVGYFETLKFANNVGVAILALIPATRPIAVAYKGLDRYLAPPPPPNVDAPPAPPVVPARTDYRS